MSIITIEELSFTWPDGAEALRGVSLSIEEGRTLGLVGRNGAGKSTLLLHLNGILSGSRAVRFRGVPIEDHPAARLRATIGLVFEDPADQLFMPAVLDDVAFGPLNMGLSPDEAEARSRRALERVGASALADRAPHHLSAGQQRRVALATVLVMEPEVLVLDEPVAGLDPEGREAVIELLGGLPQTKIIATHDLELVMELCDEVAVLDAGRIHAHGPARELLSDESLMRAHGLRVPLSLRLQGT
ncbi:MAG: ATP-binding cassette domain-containing protein [Armatimonadetes bacterium]|nr:ATP-binding cassette domain-containing protein [Armatimonadota bacterium]